MDNKERFFDLIKKEMTMMLATAGENSVTMRVVSPVYHKGNILFFTSPGSFKYAQLKGNPHCSVSVGLFFAEAEAEFLGATMLDANGELRDAYCQKFPGAFDEGIPFGGRADEFILLKPTRLKGWAFENDVPTADGVPTIPFELEL